MLKFEFRNLDSDTVAQLIELSKLWVEEDCSYGMVANEESDLQENLAVALDENRIVGYIFGHYYQQERKTSYIEVGKTCFEVDELYVHPQYRSHGIGTNLFTMMEKKVSGNCDYITLATSTKNYKAILKLYVEELGMNFHSAFLIKSMEEVL